MTGGTTDTSIGAVVDDVATAVGTVGSAGVPSLLVHSAALTNTATMPRTSRTRSLPFMFGNGVGGDSPGTARPACAHRHHPGAGRHPDREPEEAPGIRAATHRRR